MRGKFCFSVDRAGTFTDVYARLPDNKGFEVVKLLSEDPDSYPVWFQWKAAGMARLRFLLDGPGVKAGLSGGPQAAVIAEGRLTP